MLRLPGVLFGDVELRVETCSVVFNVHKVLRGRKSLVVLIENRIE
jgi:hypothetical protein